MARKTAFLAADKTTKMNILYLHGLESKLNPAKRKVLERFGKVLAPEIDYGSAYLQPERILNAIPDTEINVVMGSSMGALNAYAISDLIGRPALLFNPPLGKYGNPGPAPEYIPKYIRTSAFKQLLLGGSDEVVDPAATLAYLGNRLQKEELHLSIDPKLGHRIPLQLFEEQVSSFFSRLCY